MINCTKCGCQLQGDERFCPWCGQMVQPPFQASGYAQQQAGTEYQHPNYQPYQQYYSTSSQSDPRWVKSSGYMAWSIICIFLFWPLAIPAIIFAGKIDSQNRIGNYNMAQYYANRSKLFCTIASCIGGAAIILGRILPLYIGFLEYFF